MQQSGRQFAVRRSPRTVVGAIAVGIGAVMGTLAISAGTAAGVAETQTVPLDNDEAPVGTPDQCPDDGVASWHFVITPNKDLYSFRSITLDLDGTEVTFGAGEIIPNGRQTDNVFVAVPAGYGFDSIVVDGSSAEVTPVTGDPGFVLSHLCPGETTTTTSSTTSSSTTSSSTTSSTSSSTTLPCEWDPDLEPGDEDCVPSLTVSAICHDLDHSGEIERYWHRLTNAESVAVTVTWADGTATIPAKRSITVPSAYAVITLAVGGRPAATTPAPSEEYCQQTVTLAKVVDGPERADGEAAPVYTIQISRLVGDTYLPEGDAYQLTGGESIEVPLPSTFNPEGTGYRVDEVDAGGAHATSVTPDSFLLVGHRNETVDVVIANTFAAISLEKSVSATTVRPGDELTYTLVATNTGALTLGPVAVYDRLPSEVAYVAHTIDGGAGDCTLVEASKPQLVRCDLTTSVEPGATTPPIVLLVEVDANVATADTILNQAMAIGDYTTALAESPDGKSESRLAGVVVTGLSCNPAPGEVCDLSARIGTTLDTSPTTSVASEAPTTTLTGSAGATTTLAAELPKTGGGANGSMLVVAGLMLLLGTVLLITTRQPHRS